MEIKNFKRINKGCLIATFRLYRDVYGSNGQKLGTEWDECSYFEKNDSAWINPCAKMYESRDGTKKSYNMHGWDEALAKQIFHEVRRKITNGEYEEAQPKVHASTAPATYSEEELPF